MTEYFAESMCWSAWGFIAGYLACKYEASLQKRRHRDHT